MIFEANYDPRPDAEAGGFCVMGSFVLIFLFFFMWGAVRISASRSMSFQNISKEKIVS